jgi:hypothetical protein
VGPQLLLVHGRCRIIGGGASRRGWSRVGRFAVPLGAAVSPQVRRLVLYEPGQMSQALSWAGEECARIVLGLLEPNDGRAD